MADVTFQRVKRADDAQLRSIFEKYASVEQDGESYMTSSDFIRKFLQLLNTENYHEGSLRIFGGIIDTSKDDLISFPEFKTFEELLCVPDALYATAFRLFDTNGNGSVNFEEFKEIISQTTLQHKIPFNLNGQFVQLYFGKRRDRIISYGEFSQFLYDFHEEYAREAFRRCDKRNTGFISSDDFEFIMVTIRSHRMTPSVASNLKQVVQLVSGGDKVSFPFFTAINSLLSDMEEMKKIYLEATRGNTVREITKNEFLSAANTLVHISPLEIELLFALVELIHGTTTIILKDFQGLSPEQYYIKVTQRLLDIKAIQNPEDRNLFIEFLESIYRFTLGTIAGAIEACGMYPFDLIKTRMQAQRFIPEKMIYRHNIECFHKVVQFEGVFGLYRGLLAHLISVSMGKAIKLSMNDWMRDKLMNRKSQVTFSKGMLAGSIAGLSTAFLTHPLELIKIRVQMTGEERRPIKTSSFKVIRNIGVLGLYKGFTASILRDVPFSALFFPLYAHTKIKLQDSHGYNTASSLAIAGIIASLPGAPVSMPFDVIKTRIQMEPKPGQLAYSTVIGTAKRIYHEEGFRTFWQGTRVVKPSQFGMTLLIYELLQRLFYIDFGGTKLVGSEGTVLVTTTTQVKSHNPDHIGGYALALPIISGIESKFGLKFPHRRIID